MSHGHNDHTNGIRFLEDIVELSAIVCKTEEGLFIVTGCSHSGICNIIEYSTKLCNEDRIVGVLFDRGQARLS